ncbi:MULTISPECIES: strawberry notch-like NTP hydrolase domain-containing protein [unclassified Thioalkalivibrio]|uniref:strawberry notch-like NTP hydrolase domain-containing protein n=1 Tax=unclassified Thioalkalivibrio TaxID=2621013 RepID=UPI00037CDB6C|nr:MULTISPECIES: strawberry notch family protein [unclassified Thioalkalivibrio]
MKWIDLSEHQAAVIPQRLPSGLVVLVLWSGPESDTQPEAIRSIGFQQLPSGIWFSRRWTNPEGGLKPPRVADFSPAFPRAALKEMSWDQVTTMPSSPPSEPNALEPASNEAPKTPAQQFAPLNEESFIGINSDGERVYAGADARFVVAADGSRVPGPEIDPNGRGIVDARFLHAGSARRIDDFALLSCARGALQNAYQSGSDLGKEQIREFADTVLTGVNARTSMGKGAVAKAHEALVVANAEFANRMRLDGQSAIGTLLDDMVSIEDRIAPLSSETHTDMPLPLAACAGDLIPTADRLVTVTHSVGANASAALHPSSEVTFIADKSRTALESYDIPKLFRSSATIRTNLDLRHRYTPNSTDVLIGHIQQLDNAITELPPVDGSQFLDTALWQATHALRTIGDSGRAFLSFQAPPNGFSEAALDQFARWASTYYHVESAIDLSPSATGKPSVDPARQVFAVLIGGRRAAPDPEASRVEIQKLESLDDLAGWVTSTLEARKSLGAAQVEYEGERVSEILRDLRNKSQAAEAAHLNAYQARYIPLTRISESSTMVPKFMARPLRQAFTRLLHEKGPIDQYVGTSLGLEKDALSDGRYSAEQIDALGLMFRRMDQGKPFLIGDQTGVGKGRELAAGIAKTIRDGNRAVFFSESSALFQDIYRDLSDIGAADGIRIWSLNDDAVIRDPADPGNIVYQSDPKQTRRLLKSNLREIDETLEGVDLVLCTYSQISRLAPGEKRLLSSHRKKEDGAWVDPAGVYSLDDIQSMNRAENKGALMTWITRGASIFADEAHNAAGQSNTFERMKTIIEGAGPVVFASSTSASDAKNFPLYADLFPGDINDEQLIGTLKKGGAPLAEVVSQMLTSDGAYIRREHDIGALDVEPITDPSRHDRNVRLTNAFANVISEFGMLTSEIHRTTSAASQRLRQSSKGSPGPKAGREIGFSSSLGVGSQLEIMGRHIHLLMSADSVADHAIEDLKANRKPIIFFNSTSEALLKAVKDRHESLGPEAETPLEAAGYDITDEGIPAIPTIRDSFARVLQGVLRVDERDENNKVRRTMSIEELAQEYGLSAGKVTNQIQSVIDAIDDLAKQVPEEELRLAPLDIIRHRIAKAGFSVAELSGRKHEIQFSGEDERPRIVDRPNVAQNDIIRGFNFGEYDALIATRSGMTGISLHASRKFSDQRQRSVIKTEAETRPEKIFQMFGRAYRNDQVNTPLLKTFTTGMPYDIRRTAIENNKIRSLSANTTSNRASPILRETIDILNPVGDRVCANWLLNNPDMIDRLFIREDEITNGLKGVGANTGNSLSNKVTSRLMMLPYEEQIETYNQLEYEFQSHVRSLESRGINPFRVEEADLKARELSREVVLGAERTHYESEFDRPVELVEIEFDITVNPLTSDQVDDLVRKGSDDILHLPRVRDAIKRGAASDAAISASPMAPYRAIVENNREDLLEKTLKWELMGRRFSRHGGHDSIESALQDSKSQVFELNQRLDDLVDALSKIRIGSTITSHDLFRGDRESVVVAIQPPTPGYEHNASQYEVHLARPDASSVTAVPLTQLIQSGALDTISASIWSDNHPLRSTFDSAKSGTFSQRRYMLSGNLFSAANWASQKNVGVPFAYTDHTGVRHRAISLNEKFHPEMIRSTDIPVTDAAKAIDFFGIFPKSSLENQMEYKPSSSVKLQCNQSAPTKYAVPGEYTLQFPTKNPRLARLADHLPSAGNTTRTIVGFDAKDMGNVLQFLKSAGIQLRTPARERAWEWSQEYDAREQMGSKKPSDSLEPDETKGTLMHKATA